MTQEEDVNPGFLVSRKLSLVGLTGDNSEPICREIEELAAVENIQVDTARQKARVAYDGSKHSIDDMLAIFRKYGVEVSNSWWSRLRLGWQRQTDQNIRDNAAHEASCCSKPPR